MLKENCERYTDINIDLVEDYLKTRINMDEYNEIIEWNLFLIRSEIMIKNNSNEFFKFYFIPIKILKCSIIDNYFVFLIILLKIKNYIISKIKIIIKFLNLVSLISGWRN